MGSLVELHGVVAGYGAGDVLRGVELEVAAGEVVCLVGPNGAGKSTVLNTVSGLLTPRSGEVRMNGELLNQLSPRQRLQRGIVHVLQDRSLFPAMTVWENLLMGAYLEKDKATIAARASQATELFPIVGRRRHEVAGSLSGGEQKQVELARSLMAEPVLILLDEPSIGLEPKARHAVFESIAALGADGRTVLLVEQNARSGLAIADRGAVLDAGMVKLTGTGAELLADPEVARLYLGAARPTLRLPEAVPMGGRLALS